MLKIHLFIIALLLSHFFNTGKAQDTTKTISPTKIDIVYNHYIQNGDNSAVTGGIGSEELTVYGPSLGLQKSWGNTTIKAQLGADIISSVSTDNIDFVMSSASVLDTRSYGNAVYEQALGDHALSVYGGGGISIESDYFSIGSKVGFLKENANELSQYFAEFQMYNDDLRWGRLNHGFFHPETLVYPQELRDREWHTTYRRNSYSLKLGYSKAVSKRSIIGVFPVLTYQKGLLSTPFHRIYFNDDTQAVERLPEKRYKASSGLKWNHFLGGRYILKNTINAYTDSWNILAFSIENETAIKLNELWTLLPNIRFYFQKGSPYFAAYKTHSPDAVFYTSDYDLATNQSYNIGMGTRFSPYGKLAKRLQFNTMVLRYNFLHRTNGLNAHILTFGFQIQ